MLSVVIPAHNEEAYLPACLEAVQAAASHLGEEVETVVVLNRCTDGTRRIAESAGFFLVDVRLTIARPVGEAGGGRPPATTVRLAEPQDVPRLQEIARVSHHDSRLYADPHFARARCDDLYARWIERKCEGHADAVFVVDTEDGASGYLSCDLPEPGVGQLDLLAVAPQARGRGLAAALTAGALDWFRERGLSRARLVTQGRNANALGHFGRFGFVAERVELWLHRWRD